ncbi:MAG: trigger factor [Ignavibacteriaceae bacterium]|nr:trigger factor [Ignavibacteriaceae bacterium]
METKFNIIHESEKEIEVTLTPEDYTESLNKEVKKLEGKIEIKGFRKGKVPPQVIKRMYGESLQYEAAEEVVQKSFAEIVKGGTINPLPGTPRIVDLKFKPAEDLTYKVRYEVNPEIELKQYKGIEVEVDELVVSDSILAEELIKLYDGQSSREQVDTVDSDDLMLTLDIAKVLEDGSLDEKAGGKNMEVRLNNPNVNADIVANSQGKKAGDVFEFSFEDKHTHDHEDGSKEEHTVNFKYQAAIVKIEKINPPEKTEALFMELSNEECKTEDELREKIKKELQAYYDQRMEDLYLSKLEEKILNDYQFTPPASFLERYLNRLIEEEIEYRKKRKMPEVKRSDIAAAMRSRAERALRWFFVRENIVVEENLEVTPEKVTEVAENVSKTTGYPVDMLIQFYSGEKGFDEVKSRIFTDFLKSNNVKKLVSKAI